jgi:hypothetical protein
MLHVQKKMPIGRVLNRSAFFKGCTFLVLVVEILVWTIECRVGCGIEYPSFGSGVERWDFVRRLRVEPLFAAERHFPLGGRRAASLSFALPAGALHAIFDSSMKMKSCVRRRFESSTVQESHCFENCM